MPESEELKKERDVAIIGGGLTGMSCALHALKLGLDVIVLDSRGLADGATGRNGGHCWPEEFQDPDTVVIETEDVQAVRAFIKSLDPEW